MKRQVFLRSFIPCQQFKMIHKFWWCDFICESHTYDVVLTGLVCLWVYQWSNWIRSRDPIVNCSCAYDCISLISLFSIHFSCCWSPLKPKGPQSLCLIKITSSAEQHISFKVINWYKTWLFTNRKMLIFLFQFESSQSPNIQTLCLWWWRCWLTKLSLN